MGLVNVLKSFIQALPLSYDPAFGDPDVQKLHQLMTTGNWRDVSRSLKDIHNWHDRDFFVTVLQEIKGRPACFEQWTQEHAEDSGGWLVSGAHAIKWAWDARGSGGSETVTKKGVMSMIERLEFAEHDLSRAADLAPEDPTPYSFLLIVAMGMNWELDDVQSIWEEVIERDPLHLTGHLRCMTCLCEKWHGSHDLMFEFARRASASAPEGHLLHTLIAHAHIERWLYMDQFDNDRAARQYWKNEDVREEIQGAYAKSLGSSKYIDVRGHLESANIFAFCFSMSRNKELAKREFERIGDNFSDIPWCYLTLGWPAFNFLRHRYQSL